MLTTISRYNFSKRFGGMAINFTRALLPLTLKRGIVSKMGCIDETCNVEKLAHSADTKEIQVNGYSGLFDFTHQKEFRIYGKQRYNFIDYLTTGSFNKYNLCNYSLMLNGCGKIISDVIVLYQDNHISLINNGINNKQVENYLNQEIRESHKLGCSPNDLTISNSDSKIYYLYGSNSYNILKSVLEEIKYNEFSIKHFTYLQDLECINIFDDMFDVDIIKYPMRRNLGYKIIIKSDNSKDFCGLILNQDGTYQESLETYNVLCHDNFIVKYPDEINLKINPLEANLYNCLPCKNDYKFTQRNFKGADMLIEKGTYRYPKKIICGLRGLHMVNNDVIIPNRDMVIYDTQSNIIGTITSSCLRPRDNTIMAMGYIDLDKLDGNINNMVYIGNLPYILHAFPPV